VKIFQKELRLDTCINIGYVSDTDIGKYQTCINIGYVSDTDTYFSNFEVSMLRRPHGRGMKEGSKTKEK
jgi:hypothetical protein